MVRSFDGRAVDQEELATLCAEALRAPSAGHSAGVRLNIIGPERLGEFFTVATDATWREHSTRFAGLARAGAGVLVSTRPQDYAARYREADKESAGLGETGAWPLPYWHADAAMATMALLLLIEEAGLGAVIWGAFRHVGAVLDWAGLSDEELFGTVLVGHPDGADRPTSSNARRVPPRAERVRRLTR